MSQKSDVTVENFVSAHNLWCLEFSDLNDLLDAEPIYEDLVALYNNTKSAYNALKVSASLVIDQSIITSKMGQARSDYNDIRIKASRVLQDNKDKSHQQAPKTSGEKPLCEFKKMSIPKWNGNLRTYLRFKATFKRLVEKHLPQDLALIRLKEEALIEGTREELIVRAESSLSSAWQSLDRAFGRANLIRDTIINDVIELPRVQDLSDVQGLRHLVTQLVSAQADLQECNRESALGESAFSILMDKIPIQLRREIDLGIIENDLNSEDSFKLFITRCESAVSVEEAHYIRTEARFLGDSDCKSFQVTEGNQRTRYQKEAEPEARNTKPPRNDQNRVMEGRGKRPNPPKPKSFQGKSFISTKSPQSNSNDCIIHPNAADHDTSNCRTFFGKSAAEKKKILSDNNRCHKCFKSHKTEDCYSKHQCMEVGCKVPKMHHTMLHAACLAQVLASKSQDVVHQPKTEEERREINMFLGRLTIRPSHVAYLRKSSQGKKFLIKTSVLYDNGATLSQITNSVARSVGLKPVNTLKHLMMKTAGKAVSEDWGESNMYRVPLYDENGTLVFTILCIGVDYIGEHDGGSFEKIKPIFEEARQGEPLLEPVNGTIEILIGNNHASVFPREITKRGNVILAETQFGDIIHGAHQDLFPAYTSVSGISLSSVMNLNASKAASCLLTTISKEDDRIFKISDPALAKVKARSVPPRKMEETSCRICTAKTSEENAFDRISAVEEIPVCYRCDSCKLEPHISKEEHRRQEVYKSCLNYDAEKKVFYCRMPWKQNYQDLPDNREVAERRLLSLTNSMGKDPSLRDWYVAEFEKIINSDVLHLVSEKEDDEWKRNGGRVFYVMHFAVLNESSSSTPLRVVFDPTVPFKGIRIGDFWEAPPNLIPLIPLLILRFRERRTPIAMDFSKCYWTLHLMREESELHRVLWNKLDAQNTIETYRMLRNSWGMRPSGSLCTVAMLQIAEVYKDKYPDVYKFIKDNVYVDDGTSSVDDVASALQLAKNISYVLGQASFKIKHFIIGGKSIDITQQDVPDHVRSAGSEERVLGVLFHSEHDELSICARVNFSKKKRGARTEADVEESQFDLEFPKKFTLRMYLSIIAMIYDPNGLCSAFTIILKFELGKIFDLKLGWDTPMPDDQTQRCKDLIRYIYTLKKVRFSRCLTPESAVGNPTLVIFCDSSQNAYASVAYYNWQTTSGQRVSRIAMAKARPWPKTPKLTIPKGELLGCVLGVRLKSAIVEKSSFKFERIIFLTDSTIVCGQILRSPSEYNNWTANRLDEIQLQSEPTSWFHVRSESNVADLPTRGLTPNEFGKESIWQNGPHFMATHPSTWPITQCDKIHISAEDQACDVRINDPRMKIKPSPSTLLLTMTDQADNVILLYLEKLDISPIDRNDAWMRLKRRISRLIRFLENASALYRKLKLNKVSSRKPINFRAMTSHEKRQYLTMTDEFVPTKRELTLSALYLVRQAQKDLPDDVKRSHASLNPILDENGIWRVKGRTSQAKENPPILIPKGHALAEVLMRHYHSPSHSGSDASLALLRQEFWIIDGPRFANSFISRCTFCRFLRKKMVEVEIGPKKPEQILRSPVFSNVTVDIAGHYETKADRRSTRSYDVSTGKVWVLVIVCRVSQACHLELMEAYDTNAFLSAFSAFTQLRGKPKTVVADLGSQIKSAAGILEKVWISLKIPKIESHDPENIEWTFVPSGAHSSIGQAERMVQIFKKTMEAMTFCKKPELSKLKFQRLLYNIANVINDKPIGLHNARTSKLDADRLLRPNDLILGRSTSDISPLVSYDTNENDFNRTIAINNALVENWWQKWYTLIFHRLFPREKWTKPGRQMQKGDIVLIREKGAIVNKWTWGEINDVNQSNDGIIRTVNVRYKVNSDRPTRSKFVTKSVRDLCVILPSEER